MRFRRTAVALSTMLVIVTGSVVSIRVGPAVATTRGSKVTIQHLTTSPMKVHGYRLVVSVERLIAEGTIQFTFMTVTLERDEPATNDDELLQQIHEWGWQLPKRAFHVHRDLAHGWIDTGVRMGDLGHLHMRFASAQPSQTAGTDCGDVGSRSGHLDGNTGTAFLLRADSTFFGTLKARHFGATVSESTECSSNGGGGRRHCGRPFISAFFADEPTRPAMARLTRSAVTADATTRPGGMLRRVLTSAAAHQFAIVQRSRGFNVLEFATGGRHEAHVMILLTGKPFLGGGVTTSATDLQIEPPPDTAAWLSGTETIAGPGDPAADRYGCKQRVFRSFYDGAATSVAGGGGALTAHFDSVGDVEMQDGLSGSAQQVRRVS